MPHDDGVITHSQAIAEFFRDVVKKAIVNLHIKASDIAEFYIVNLLDHFTHTSHLFDKQGDKLDDTPLALLLERTLHASVAERIRTLKYIGDLALYISGFFPLYIYKRSVDMNYYANMGGGAYLTLSRSVGKPETFGELYEELGMGFEKFVVLLTEVNAIARKQSNVDLIKLYEQWIRTGDSRLESVLNREGISTTTPIKTEQ